MPKHQELIKDSKGNIVTCPVTGWITGLVAGSSVLLAVQYIQSDSEFSSPEGGTEVQLVLTPIQALELGEKLKTLGKNGMEATGPRN